MTPLPAADTSPGPPVKGLISVEEATARLLAMAAPLPFEEVSLARAAGRRLARAVTAVRDQPPFDASAMDGYALAGDPAPGDSFRVIGEAGAGHAFAGVIGSGQAVRIFTGAPVPDGADRVIIQENVSRDGDRITLTAPDRNTNIRPRGQDFPAGASLAPRRLRAADLSLLAAMNVARVPCARRPVVAILSTGDELVLPGETPRPDQIIASNGFALKALVEGEAGEARLLPVARDDRAALATLLEMARPADVIVTIGGASVGEHDLVGEVTAGLGMERAFWKIALRPGKPLIAGRLGQTVLLGLPGNPVSSIVCAHLFLLPLLRAMQGDPSPLPRPLPAVLATDLPANGPRAHYMRAVLDDTRQRLSPFARQDSALLAELAQADALLVRPPHDGARRAGDPCIYLPI